MGIPFTTLTVLRFPCAGQAEEKCFAALNVRLCPPFFERFFSKKIFLLS